VRCDSEDPDVQHFVERIAVEIDRTRAPIIDGVRRRMIAAQLPQRLKLSAAGMQLLPFLRNLLPDRSVERDALRACERYIADTDFAAAVDELIDAEVIEADGSGIALSEGGREVAHEMHDALVEVVDERWGHRADFARLERLVQRALDAAAPTGGLSFSVMVPPFDPPRSTSASRSAERLNCLRLHRGDAHAEAWIAAGLTAEEVRAMGNGAERDAIERETNVRASGPYALLVPDDRALLLAILRTLPG
jgi:hypothetical protein